tara:strand:+ start:2648 stop:3331 length:684 start_codon:yes stop_codon:yes gene_type:complete
MTTFAKYKNVHEGKNCFLIGTGPTFNEFDQSKVMSEDNFFIGVNEVPLSGIHLDYWFMQDPGRKYNGDPSNRGFDANEEFFRQFTPRLGKFVGRLNTVEEHRMPENIENAEYYNLRPQDLGNMFELDLTENELKCGASVSFSALQFALFAGFKKIYLVGQDCNYQKGIFHSEKAKTDFQLGQVTGSLLEYWSGFAKMTQELGVEVYSINPVGLTPDKYFKEVKLSEL